MEWLSAVKKITQACDRGEVKKDQFYEGTFDLTVKKVSSQQNIEETSSKLWDQQMQRP